MPSIDPTSAQFKDFMTADKTEHIQMLNMIRYRDSADYTGFDDLPCSGAEAYARYKEAAAPFVAEVGATIEKINSVRRTLIGPEDEQWDLVFIVNYPSREAMQKMLTNPGYQAIIYHRRAAIADSRLVELAP